LLPDRILSLTLRRGVFFNFVDGYRGMRTFRAPKAQERDQAFDWISLGIDSLYEEHHVNAP